MAKAVATGDDGAVVEATATVFCSATTAQAKAWSEAVAQSVKVNPVTGCAIVQRMVARSQATCTNGVASTNAQSFVTRQVLPGSCNVLGAAAGGSVPVQQQQQPQQQQPLQQPLQQVQQPLQQVQQPQQQQAALPMLQANNAGAWSNMVGGGFPGGMVTGGARAFATAQSSSGSGGATSWATSTSSAQAMQ
jgi:hypothetical protein